MSWKATAAVKEHSGHKGSALLMMLLLAEHHTEVGPLGQMIWVPMKQLAIEARVTERNVRYLISRLIRSGELYCYGIHRRSKVHVYGINLPGLPQRDTLARLLLGSEVDEFVLAPEPGEQEKISSSVETGFRENPDADGEEQENISYTNRKSFPISTEGNRKGFPVTPYIDQDHVENKNDLDNSPLTPRVAEGGQGAAGSVATIAPKRAASAKKPQADPAVVKALGGKGTGRATSPNGHDKAAAAELDNKREAPERPQDAPQAPIVATDTGHGAPVAGGPVSAPISPDREAPGSVEECLAWFEGEFWPAYPAKVGKKDCIGWVKRKRPSAVLRDKIVLAIKARRRLDDGFDAGETPPTPHPYTWLNGERWDDVIRGRNGAMFEPADFERIVNPPVRAPVVEPDGPVVDDEPPTAPAVTPPLQQLYDDLGIRSEDQGQYTRMVHEARLREAFRETLFFPPEDGNPALVVFQSAARCEAIKSRTGETYRRSMNTAIQREYRTQQATAVYLSTDELRAMLKQDAQ